MEGDRPVQRLFPGYPGISIHSLRMEGDRHMLPRLRHALISIHSLRMEGDAKILFHVKRFLIFQSTPSAWRETFRGADDISGNLFQSTPSAWRETQGKRFCA